MQTTIRVDTAGAAGTSTGSNKSDFQGKIHSLTIRYGAGIPATTRVRIFLIIADVETEIFDKVGSTKLNHFPGIQLQDKAGAGLTNGYVQHDCNFGVRVDVSLSNALTEAVTVIIQ